MPEFSVLFIFYPDKIGSNDMSRQKGPGSETIQKKNRFSEKKMLEVLQNVRISSAESNIQIFGPNMLKNMPNLRE